MQRIVTIIVCTAAWNSDEKNRDAVFAAWAKYGLSRDELEKCWVAGPLKERFSPLLVDFFLANLRRSIDEAMRFGLIDNGIDVDDWVEPKYLQRALEELGLEDFWPEFDAAGKPTEELSTNQH